MTIVLCGGGSGGHITPLLAVASELRRRHKDVKLVYIGEKGSKFSHLVTGHSAIDEQYFISAGKLRRYHGESILTKLLDVKTIFLNIRDVFKLTKGTVEAYLLLRRLKPGSILLKGGFVCVPVAVAAKINQVPYITHDSDALPGLANRIAARWAKYQTTALPAKYYSYPSATVRTVGIPTAEGFRKYTSSEQRILKEKYGIGSPEAQVLLITGGSHGARRLNKAVLEILPKLLSAHPDLYVMHQIGQGNDDQIKNFPRDLEDRVKFFGFSSEIYYMSAIADLIVARAGASAMADYAAQHKPCIVVPNPYLTGGHQLKNAEVYKESNAAEIVKESEMVADPDNLYKSILNLLSNPERRSELADNLASLSPNKNAAATLAELTYEIGK